MDLKKEINILKSIFGNDKIALIGLYIDNLDYDHYDAAERNDDERL